MVNAVEDNNWTHVVKALNASERLLQATLDGNEEAVARGIDAAQYADRSAMKETLGLSKNLLLVGINYDRETKQHECHIEKYEAMGM